MARILIVEDERITAEYLREVVADLGHTASIVSTGPDAITHVKNCFPDLVLMDIRLQGPMDGIEATRIIRGWSKVPVIYLTALIDHETRERAESTTPIGYTSKPVREFDLQARIEFTLQQQPDSRNSRAVGA